MVYIPNYSFSYWKILSALLACIEIAIDIKMGILTVSRRRLIFLCMHCYKRQSSCKCVNKHVKVEVIIGIVTINVIFTCSLSYYVP